MKNFFEAKKKVVLAGESRIFKDWTAHSSITAEDFIAALEWICEDDFDDKHRTTRAIGLTPEKIVKLKTIYDRRTGLAGYIELEDFEKNKIHSWWNGAIFEDGFNHKIMLSAKDRI